jgi:hypothetical protein
MTTLTASAALPVLRTPLRRVGDIVRLHLANPFTIIITPLLILVAILAINLVIWALILRGVSAEGPAAVADASEGMQYSGMTLWTYVYMFVVAVQAMNLTFPLALGFGATRREFYVGSVIAFIGLSAVWATIYALLGVIEEVTGGWGMGGQLFRSIYFGDGPWLERWYVMFALFSCFYFVGAAIAAVYVRWRQRGLLGFFGVLTVLLLAAVAGLTLTESWPAFGAVFVALGYAGSYTLGLLLAVVAAIAGWLVLRRATPRS